MHIKHEKKTNVTSVKHKKTKTPKAGFFKKLFNKLKVWK